MTEQQMQQLEAFFTSQLGSDWKTQPIAFMDGLQVTEALWPLNEVFQQHHYQISSLPYSTAFETEADRAISLYVNGGAWSLDSPGAGAWRVLMERHIQSIVVAMANEAAGNKRLVPVPQDLPVAQYKHVAMLYLQWAMVLPFPVENRASYEWPANAMAGSLRRQ